MSGCSPLTHDRIPVWNTTRLRASFSIGCSIQHTRAKIQSLTDQQAQLLKRSTYGGMTAEDAKEYDLGDHFKSGQRLSVQNRPTK
jgi:hypothetical protein